MSPPGRDIQCNATSPWGESIHHRGRREAPGDFLLTQMYANSMYHDNLQPTEPVAYDPHTANAIHPGHWSTASIFSALNIVAFRHCFKLNRSDVKTTSGAQSSCFLSLSSSHGYWRRNAPQTSRARCVVSGGVINKC